MRCLGHWTRKVPGDSDPIEEVALFLAAACAKPAGETLDPAELHLWCKSHMARFMVPRFIEVRDEMPHISVGKVKKDELQGVGEGVWEAPDS